VLDVLAENSVLTVFLVIAAGSLVGLIPFRLVRFGPAGALFVGLALGALDPRLGSGLGLVRLIGLALFVYTVGLTAGPTLIRTFCRQALMMVGSVVVLVLVGAATVAAGLLLGVSGGFLGGVYAGVGTSTSSLAAATQAAGNQDPAAGYALTYPIGVVLTILAIQLEMSRHRASPKDRPSAAAASPTSPSSSRVGARLMDVPGAAQGLVRFAFWQHDGAVDVAGQGDTVKPGDRVVIVGPQDAVTKAVQWLGRRAHSNLAHDRTEGDYRRVLISRSTLSGRSIAELDIAGRYGGIGTRVRRGDLDLLARGDLHVQLGGRLRVVVPRGRMPELATYLGDRSVSSARTHGRP
jgi:putative transport protein